MALFASSFARLVGRARAPTNAMLKSNICTLNKKNFQKKEKKAGKLPLDLEGRKGICKITSKEVRNIGP
jgi:hypothetical protein